MKKIGITGGIATGKSTFCKILKELGYPVFSADEVVKELYQKKEIQERIKSLLNLSKIDKKKILILITQSPEAKKLLEDFFFPLVKEKLFEFFKKQEKNRFVFAEIPLLFEAGWEKFFDEVWVIACSRETQFNRLKERLKNEELVKRLISLQLPLDYKIKKANRTFSSEKSLEELKKEVQTLLKVLSD